MVLFMGQIDLFEICIWKDYVQKKLLNNYTKSKYECTMNAIP